MNFFVSKQWSRILLLISLLVLMIVMAFVGRALGYYSDYKQVVDPKMEMTVDRFHFFLKTVLAKEKLKYGASYPVPDAQSALKTFHISVDPVSLEQLNEDLPLSGKEFYVNGQMKVSDSEKTVNIKLRYRGDHNFHWLYEQKSLRIKLGGDDLYGMEKTFNLVNPPHWFFHRDMIVYDLARELGLVSPEYYPVRVFINGGYKGVYIYLSQPDESLLRKQRVMPGSIYSGDFAEKNERGVKNLWGSESYWVKKSSRNAEQRDNRDDLRFYLTVPYIDDEKEFYDVFSTQFDKNKFFGFVAIDRLFGSGHHDYRHNHKIYFDPYKGFFEPVEWDVRDWSIVRDKDIGLYPLLLKLKNNPVLDSEIDKLVFSLIKGGIAKRIHKRIEEIHEQVSVSLTNDFLKDNAIWNQKLFSNWVSMPFSMEEYSKWMFHDKFIVMRRKNILLDIYNDVAIKYKLIKHENNKISIKFKVEGNSPVVIDFGSGVRLQESLSWNLESDAFNKVRLYPGRKLLKDVREVNVVVWGKDDVVSVPQYYEVFVDAINISDLTNIRAVNYITGESVVMSSEDFIVEADDSVLHPSDFVNVDQKSVTFNGVVKLDETRVYDRLTSVTILPGTTFVLGENVSLYFYGKVTAKGSKESPIRFLAKDPSTPWGIVAIQGKATTGSVFEYIEVENGSVDTRNHIQYTSPFNIHDTGWFEVRNCKIGQNHLGDDSMHIAYAKGVIDHCYFYDARSDALDVDISEISVTNSVFYNSGNDGLDVMTTSMVAVNNVFVDTGDKGISVGEWSDVELGDSLFLRTFIGLEVKDKSKVQANNLIFDDSLDKAVNLYNKNKRYDEGGFLNARNIYLLGNKAVSADKRSTLSIENIVEDTMPNLGDYDWSNSLLYKKIISQVHLKDEQEQINAK